MAKKKPAKGPKTKAAEPALPPERKEAADFLATVDEAMEQGSYAGVRMLAERAPAGLDDAERAGLSERVGRVTVDPVQLAVGGFAIVCVMIAAALTLVTG
jgi:hypothetical protein